jgi:hypothetical protein
MHLVRAAIYGVRGRAVKRANAPDDRLGGAIEFRFDIAQRWIASSQALLAITDDAALRESRNSSRCAGPVDAALLSPSPLRAEPCRAAFFLRNIFRFCVATAGSAATARPRDCRRKVRFCLMPFIVTAALPRVRRMPAARLRDSPHRG